MRAIIKPRASGKTTRLLLDVRDSVAHTPDGPTGLRFIVVAHEQEARRMREQIRVMFGSDHPLVHVVTFGEVLRRGLHGAHPGSQLFIDNIDLCLAQLTPYRVELITMTKET